MFPCLLAGALAVPRVLEFDMQRTEDPLSSVLQKRDNKIFSHDLFQGPTSYYINFELGTPPQSMRVFLDTGSSDFYVLDPNTTICLQGQCGPGTVFNYTQSSTIKKNNTKFATSYADGTSAEGFWFQDVLRIGDVEIDHFNFGIAEISTSNVTIGGIGLPIGESPYLLNDISTPYANFPLQLKQSGAISYVAYSLWLNGYSQNCESILFGGIDTTRFQGDLYTFPMLKSYEDVLDFAIKLDGMHLYTPDGGHQRLVDTSIPVILDSGTTITTLPFEVLHPLMEALNATNYNGSYLVPCQTLVQGGGVGLVFSGIEYLFNFVDIAVPLTTKPGLCFPGFDVLDGTALIGDNLLRSLYVVYDLENLEIGLALANTDSSQSTVSPSYLALETGIPGTKAPRYSQSSLDFYVRTYQATFVARSNTGSGSFSGRTSQLGTNETQLLFSPSTDSSSDSRTLFNTGITTVIGTVTKTGIHSAYTLNVSLPLATSVTRNANLITQSSSAASSATSTLSHSKNAAFPQHNGGITATLLNALLVIGISLI